MGATLPSPERPDYLTTSEIRGIAKCILTIEIIGICIVILILITTALLNNIGSTWMLNLIVTPAGTVMISITAGMTAGMIVSALIFFITKEDDSLSSPAVSAYKGGFVSFASLVIAAPFLLFLPPFDPGFGIPEMGLVAFIINLWVIRFTLPAIMPDRFNGF